MRRRVILALAVALAIPGCFGLKSEVVNELTETSVEPGETTTAEIAEASHDVETDALTFVVRDDTTRRSERVDRYEESRSWSVGYFSVTDSLYEKADEEDDAMMFLIGVPFTLSIDLLIPIGSLIAAPFVIAFGEDLDDSTTRTPLQEVEQRAWAPLELYDPTTGARTPAVNGTRAGDLALNGFRSTELTAIGPDGQERPLKLPSSVAQVFSEVAAGWDRAPEHLRVRVPLATSLADAARGAPEGAWLQLEAGDYQLDSTLYLFGKRLTIAGRGAGATRLHSRGVAFNLGAATQEVTLRGLSIELDGSTVSDAVRSSGGRLVVIGCAFSGARFEEVPPPPQEPPAPGEAPKPPAGPSYRGGVALNLEGEGYTEVRSSVFTGPGTIGVLATGAHRARVFGSSFDGSKLEGVSFRGESRENLVSGCTFRGPGHGVGVLGKSAVCVQTSDIQVTRAGILVDNEASIYASRNRPHGCSTGISVQGKSSGTVADNTGDENGATVLVETDGTYVVVSGNTCTNGNNGISLQGKSSVDVHGNTCSGSGAGILVTGSVSGQIYKNTLERNKNGVSIQDGASPRVHDNTIRSNTDVGILVSGSGTPDLRKNDIRENKNGIGVQGTLGTRPTIEDNDIASNQNNGIQVGVGLQPTIQWNRIVNNPTGLYGFVAPNNTFTNNGDQRGY